MSESGATHTSQPRFRARARVRPKAQLTLPEEIRRALHVGEGDEVEFSVHADGTITVRGYVSVPSDQAWFFTQEGLAAKQRADDEIAAGGRVDGVADKNHDRPLSRVHRVPPLAFAADVFTGQSTQKSMDSAGVARRTTTWKSGLVAQASVTDLVTVVRP